MLHFHDIVPERQCAEVSEVSGGFHLVGHQNWLAFQNVHLSVWRAVDKTTH